MKILHSGDWHISNRGTVARRYIIKDGINQTLLDRIYAIGRICDYAEENEIDLIVIAGDLFDHSNPENISILVAVEAIERLSEQAPVIIVKGNHDGGKGSEIANALAPFKWKSPKFGVYVSDRPELFTILTQKRKIQVFTLPYPRKSGLLTDPQYKTLSPEELNGFVSRKMEEILSGFHAGIDREAVNVLVGHITVAGGCYSKEQIVPMFDISIRKEFLEPFDVVCLGHLHEVQEYYCGAIARSGFGEEDMKVGFKVHHVEDKYSEFIELPARRYLTIQVDEFMKNEELTGVEPETVIRIKGKVKKHEYDSVVRKIKSLEFPFVKNAVEIESEVVRLSENDQGNDPTLEEAIRIWAQGRDGYDKLIDLIVAKAKEIEGRWKTRETDPD
jgi:exonuclease SbcD